MRKVTIYTLSLEDGKYYVGKTTDPVNRIVQHYQGIGSKWTEMHRPIDLHAHFEGDDFDEDKTVKQMMQKHGIDKVRGGS